MHALCRGCFWLTLFFALAVRTAAAEPATTSRLHWVTNGIVRAAAVHDQTLYIGGSFTRVAPASNFLGPWFGVSTTTGAPLPRLPLADGAVLAIEPDGAGGYFVGGRFTRIGGVFRTALAHVLTDGTIDPAFAPVLVGAFPQSPNPPVLDVRALARAGDTLYVGGSFRLESSGTSRDGVAALDVATGSLRTGFQAPLPMRTERILVHGGRVVAMGHAFPGIVPAGIPSVVAADAATGAPLWTRDLGVFGTVFDAVVAGGRLIVAGRFAFYTPVPLADIASLDPASGVIDTTWRPVLETMPGDVYAVTAVGSTIYIGGRFSTVAGQPRTNVAAIDVALGRLTAWAPAVEGTVRDLTPASGSSVYVAGDFRRAGGQSREALAEIDATGAVTPWTAQAYSTDVATLHLSGGTLVAGGASAVAGGVAREKLAAFALDAADVLPWAPAAPDDVTEVATDGSRVFAGLGRLAAAPVGPGGPTVVAFDGITGAPSAWAAPDGRSTLLGAFDGQVYVNALLGNALYIIRLDATTGAIDASWRVTGNNQVRLIPVGDLLFMFGDRLSAHDEGRDLAAVHVRTGAVSPWNPRVFAFNSFGQTIPAAAIMGRTMYIAYNGHTTQTLAGVDTESGRMLPFPAPVGGRVLELGAADGLVFTASVPDTPAGAGVAAFRPDGTQAEWNPDLRLTETHPSWPAQPRIVTTDADLVVVGVQSLLGTPVHGVAVFARQPPVAPSALEASELDGAVRLTWVAPEPPSSSYVIEVGSMPGASNLLVQDTNSSTPALDAVAPPGTYFVRVKTAGATPGSAAAAATNEIALTVGCTAPPPLPPSRLAATVNGARVTLEWEAPAFTPVARYVIEAGSAAGRTDLARLTLPGSRSTFDTDAPPGTYFVRVRAENACGFTPATPDVWLTVGGAALPAAPQGLTITDLTPGGPVGVPHLYTVQWAPLPGATGYILEVGSRPGLANLVLTAVAGTTLGPAGVAWGRTLFVRVRAVGAAGTGPPSAEYVLIAQ